MKKAVVYLHGMGGNAAEGAHYAPLFPDCEVIGFDYRASTPWEAREEFPPYFDALRQRFDSVSLIANSIGAYFAMQARIGDRTEEAFFISPVCDMEVMISSMMQGAGVTEEELREKKEIALQNGQILSWEYLRFVRENPIEWKTPTHILYGERDALVAFSSVSAFAEKTGATLNVMKNGEHWFHTEEQMRFLDEWIRIYQ